MMDQEFREKLKELIEMSEAESITTEKDIPLSFKEVQFLYWNKLRDLAKLSGCEDLCEK